MVAVDVTADSPAHGRAYKYIRREVVAAHDARHADARGKTVDAKLDEAIFLTGCQDRGGRPRNRAVFRRKGRVEARSGLEELALCVVNAGALAPGSEERIMRRRLLPRVCPYPGYSESIS